MTWRELADAWIFSGGRTDMPEQVSLFLESKGISTTDLFKFMLMVKVEESYLLDDRIHGDYR